MPPLNEMKTMVVGKDGVMVMALVVPRVVMAMMMVFAKRNWHRSATYWHM